MEKLNIKKERRRKYYLEHKQIALLQSYEWRKNNPEKAKEYHKNYFPKWKSENMEQIRQLTKNRKARLKGAVGEVTLLEWKWLKEKYFNLCLACFKRGSEIKLTQDHIVPISKGGKNIIGNIQPLCKPCNSTKSTKITDYRQI